jgi:isopentenyl diphosphate isomerase/L-lactate dehydrogenase-like FMN-dependent dehydrogenase
VTQLEQFLFEEACRLEQAAALTGRARELDTAPATISVLPEIVDAVGGKVEV